jgi:hypothetical protein
MAMIQNPVEIERRTQLLMEARGWWDEPFDLYMRYEEARAEVESEMVKTPQPYTLWVVPVPSGYEALVDEPEGCRHEVVAGSRAWAQLEAIEAHRGRCVK